MSDPEYVPCSKCGFLLWHGEDAHHACTHSIEVAALRARVAELEAALDYQARCPACGLTDCDLEHVLAMAEADKTANLRDGTEKARAAQAKKEAGRGE